MQASLLNWRQCGNGEVTASLLNWRQRGNGVTFENGGQFVRQPPESGGRDVGSVGWHCRKVYCII